MMAVLSPKRANGRQAGLLAYQCAFIIIVWEDVTEQLMWEHFPVSIFYKCNGKKATAKLMISIISSLSITNMLQSCTFKGVKLKDKAPTWGYNIYLK